MTTFDLDGDGELSYNEFIDAIASAARGNALGSLMDRPCRIKTFLKLFGANDGAELSQASVARGRGGLCMSLEMSSLLTP